MPGITDRMRKPSLLQLWSVLALLSLAGCPSGKFPTLTIYETPQTFVRLEADRTIDPAKGHSHPADISAERMASLLRGVIVQEPLTRLPLYDDLSIPRRHQAFDEASVILLAPLLSHALRKATPEEVVTFYQTSPLSGTNREVTSGGLFVRGGELHLILANHRSPTHYSADIGMADTTDDRSTPMHSLAPQRGKLLFEPAAAAREATGETLTRWFKQDRREIIVLYNRLAPAP
jgi:hypothetical protein